MAPKKKQQQQKQKHQQQNNKQKPQSSSSSAAGPKLQLSAENEQRLRRLLLNNSSDAAILRPTLEESQSHSNSLSKAQKVKKLKSIYENLSCEGFSDDQIERALSALKDAASLEAALDWLCLNLSRSELPVKFRDGLSLHTGGSISVVSTAQENWISSIDTTARSQDEVLEYSIITRSRHDDDSLDLHEPSQADWIRQYMEKEEEMESESWEDMLSDEGSCKKVAEPRSYDTVVQEYQSARMEAIAAKEKGDKQSQEVASKRIRMLKQEMSALGEYDVLMSEISNTEACCSVYEEYNSSLDALADPLIGKVEMEHCFKDEVAEQSITVNDVAASQEDGEDTELGNLFIEDDSFIAALPLQVSMTQNKVRVKDKPASKDLEKLEGIWKKGDATRIPKAVLHQLCQRSGWDPPKFDKVGKKGSGFSYCVSVVRKSTGRGKNRRSGGLITLQLPGQDESFNSSEEAQNRVAAFALYRLFPDIPTRFLITETYASLIVKWEEGESSNMIEDTLEDRRAGFVDSLLNADSSVEITSAYVADVSNQNEVSDVCSEKSAAAAFYWDNSLMEKECFLLRQELENKRKTPRYKSMLEARAGLPIAKSRDEILWSLKQNNVVVVCGETGSGKTTQVPQYILDDLIAAGRGGHCNIVCTQPRRIAAISVAERVADERCEPAPGLDGSLVGYQVRLDTARNDRTKLLFCTTGILLRQIAGNKSFHGVTHVVVDEVHERSLLGDFLLIVLKNILENQSTHGTPTFKVILMSATVDSNLISRYFGDCPVITAEGRTYPVSTIFLEDVYEEIDYHLPSDSPACLGFKTFGHKIVGGSIDNRRGMKNLVLSSLGDEALLAEECMNPQYNPRAYQSYSEQTRLNLRKLNEDVIDYDLLEDLVCYIDEHSGDGAILVFLPGMSEINRLHDKLAASYRFGGESSEWLLPLHSSVAPADQKKVFLKPPKNTRKIIMATNIAETSLTIDDVVYVVDSGKHKEYRYDPRKKLSMMVEDWISQANAKQRRGRAGRVKPGTCFCLYTRHRFENLMRPFQVPEMLRMPLVELCLQIKLLSLGDIKLFLSKALDMPKDEAVNSAISSLKEVGAVDKHEELTPLGHHLAKLPVDLLLGKMMLYGAIFGCLSPILSIAAFLSYKSPFVHLRDEREFLERSKLAILSDKTDGSSSIDDKEGQSDHIIMMIAYKKWEKILREKGVKAAQFFCKVHALSGSVLHMIRDMRVQFGTLLSDIGLVHLPEDYQGRKKGNLDSWFSDASQPFNKYANHFPVVKAILCAGLYPNVAATIEGIHAPALGNLRQSLKSISKGSPAWYDGRREVHIHPSSVNGDSKTFQHAFLVFLEKVETRKVFLRDTTIISPYSLLLFGGAINVQHQLGLVTVDGWLKITAPAQTAVLFKELRSTLQSVLNGMIRKPQRIAVENEVVRSIIHLLLEETKPQA